MKWIGKGQIVYHKCSIQLHSRISAAHKTEVFNQYRSRISASGFYSDRESDTDEEIELTHKSVANFLSNKMLRNTAEAHKELLINIKCT